MSVCDENCRDCAYRAWMGFRLSCKVLGVTGRRRGCPAGTGCTEKIAGEARQSIEAMVYKLPPSSLSAGMPGDGSRCLPQPPVGDSALPEGAGDGEAKRRKKALTAEEIAERKRKKAEYHRKWAARNREKVLAYQRERWRRKREAEPAPEDEG